MELPEQMERVYMDGLGRVITDNRIKGMFPQKMVDNMQKDLNQYKRYKEVLGDSIGSLAKFGQMKYNDSEMWKFLQLDYERQKELKSHPELKLPNLENLVVSDTKFTKIFLVVKMREDLQREKPFQTGWDTILAIGKNCRKRYANAQEGIQHTIEITMDMATVMNRKSSYTGKKECRQML